MALAMPRWSKKRHSVGGQGLPIKAGSGLGCLSVAPLVGSDDPKLAAEGTGNQVIPIGRTKPNPCKAKTGGPFASPIKEPNAKFADAGPSTRLVGGG